MPMISLLLSTSLSLALTYDDPRLEFKKRISLKLAVRFVN